MERSDGRSLSCRFKEDGRGLGWRVRVGGPATVEEVAGEGVRAGKEEGGALSFLPGRTPVLPEEEGESTSAGEPVAGD